MHNRRYSISFLAIVFLCSVLIASEELSIFVCSPNSTELGENLQINITVVNNMDYQKNVTLRVNWVVPEELVEPKENLVIIKIPEGMRAFAPPYLEWNLTLLPLESKTVSYIVRPSMVGDHVLQRIDASSDGKLYSELPKYISVTCNSIQCFLSNPFAAPLFFGLMVFLSMILIGSLWYVMSIRKNGVRQSPKAKIKN